MRFLAFLPLFLVATICAQTHQADIVIYGGTSAGVIAGIQAAKLGKKVIVVEPGEHIGGMAVEGLGARTSTTIRRSATAPPSAASPGSSTDASA